MPAMPKNEHYEDCPAADDQQARCRCDAIRDADDSYWSEPDNMADREWGSGYGRD